MIDYTTLNEEERAIYNAGRAEAIRERREIDKQETEAIYRRCTRKPDPLTHYSNLLAESERRAA